MILRLHLDFCAASSLEVFEYSYKISNIPIEYK